MVENALNIMLSGNEPIVQVITEEHGLEAADNFISKFNNACLHLAALEQDVKQALHQNHKRFLCPVENFSELAH